MKLFVKAPVPVYAGGGLFSSLINPAQGKYNISQYGINTQYVPTQPAMVPVEAFQGVTGPAKPTLGALDMKDLKDKMGDVHGSYYESFHNKYNQTLAEIDTNLRKHGEDWLLSNEARRLYDSATNFDWSKVKQAQNIFSVNKKMRDEAGERIDDYYIDNKGLMTFWDPNKNQEVKAHYTKVDELKTKGYRPVTGADQFDLRESNPDATFALTQMDDYRGQRLWREADKDLRGKFSGVGHISRGQQGYNDTITNIGSILGYTKGGFKSSGNKQQIQSAISSLLGNGVDQSDYHAFVKNFISSKGGYTAKDGNGKSINADEAFVKYVLDVANSNIVDEYDSNSDFVESSELTKAGAEAKHKATAGALYVAREQLDRAYNGEAEFDQIKGLQVGQTYFPSLLGKQINFGAGNTNVTDGVFDAPLSNDVQLKIAGDMEQAQTVNGKLLSKDGLNRTFRNGQRAFLSMLPVDNNGKVVVNINEAAKQKMDKLQKNYEEQAKTGDKQQATSAYLQGLKQLFGDKYQFRSFYMVSVTGSENTDERYAKDEIHKEEVKGAERNIAMKSYIKHDLDTDSKITDPSTWTSNVKNRRYFNTMVFIPMKDDPINQIQGDAGAPRQNGSLPSSVGVTASGDFPNREHGGLIPEKKTLIIRPLSIQDLD